MNITKDIVMEKLRGKKKDEELLIDIHHVLMKFYHCWIPIEELKKIPIPTIAGLLERIEQDKKRPDPIPVVIMGIAKKSIGGIKTLGGKHA